MKGNGMHDWFIYGAWLIFSFTMLSLLFWDIPLASGLILGSRPDPNRPGHLISVSPSLPWFWVKVALLVVCAAFLTRHYLTRRR